MNKSKTRKLVIAAMLSALSTVLMYLDFPIPLMPPFLKFDFSELPVLIGTFILGIPWGIAIAVIKVLLHALRTSTMYVGEISNLILSVSMVLSAGLVYKRNKTKKGAIIALIISTITIVIVGALTNRYFILWAYVNMMGFTMEKIISMCQSINPAINSVNAYILFGVVPFNILKAGITAIVTYFSYDKLKNSLKLN